MDYIIPTKNNEKTIGAAIDSIKAFGDPNNIIIIDSCSSDNTRKIALEKNCLVFVVSKMATLGYARRYGAQMANSEYIVFVDSDIELLPEWSKMLEFKFPDDIGAVSAFIPGSPLYGRTLPLKLMKGQGTFGCTITKRDLFLGFKDIIYFHSGEDLAYSRCLNSKGYYWYCTDIPIKHPIHPPKKFRWYGSGVRKSDGFKLSYVKKIVGGAILGINQRHENDTYFENWKVRMNYLLGYVFPNRYAQLR